MVPGWVPVLPGRRIPPAAVLAPAALGATALTLLSTVLGFVTEIRGTTIRGDALSADFPSRGGGWEAGFSSLCHAPLVLWGPLLAVLTVAYGNRRPRARG
ncbi:hypothetical protein ACIBG6_34805 [Streptomyces sp. NPDC050842]|uniref:hypothetical protein n=1 Tax=Streptomyces sp. NPDC050842 TaxID=3365636 RepID=UPI0037B4AC27